jgi:pyridoxamine 5'-phosphate oxidase
MKPDIDQMPLLEEKMNKSAMKQFKTWFDEAESSGMITEVDAAVLSTVDKDLVPHSRYMKILDFNKNGLIFVTSLSSKKVEQFTQNPNVTLLYTWSELNRQVIINGTVKKMNDKKSEMYFDKLNRWGKVGAIINKQSSKVASRKIIDDKFSKFLTKYNYDSVHIKKPDHMCAFMIIPQSIEFFQGRSCKPAETPRTFSYSDRIKYTKDKDGSKWNITRLWS